MVVPARAERRQILLRPGIPMDQAIDEALAGADSAWISLAEARGDLSFVLPDHARDGLHAAWYSEEHHLLAATIHRAGIIWGRRDGQGFGHCHGLWGGTMGHLLLPRSRLAAPIRAQALIFHDARFDAENDPETGFSLFKPRALTRAAPMEGDPDAALIRLAPHVDLADAVEAALVRLGWPAALLEGLGSLNTARFADGVLLDSHATEFLLRPGRIAPGQVSIDMDIVGIAGVRAGGLLTAAGNRICVTAELILSRC